MKKGVLFIFVLFISINSYASHLYGYDLTLQNTGSGTYKVILKFYRGNFSGAVMPLSLNFKTYKKSDNSNANLDFTLNRVSLYNSSYNESQGCLTGDANSILQVGVFEYTITAIQSQTLNNAEGYYITSGHCCRNAEVMNINNADALGMLFTMEFPRLSPGSITVNNNSPKFTKEPLLKYIVGKSYTIDWSATDADGDSLVYSLVKPLDDNPVTIPFSEIDYKSGYGIGTNLADGNPDFQINSSTGVITYKPTMAGSYSVAVKVDEYRNGVKIGEIRREMQFLTVITNELAPIVSSNFDDVNDIVDTIDFSSGTSQIYSLIFKAKDIGDSLSLFVLPDISIGENIFDPNTFKAEFGAVGNTQTGSAALYPVGMEKDSVHAEFKWNVSSFMGRENPYSLQVYARDKTCPSGLTDTINIKLYVNYKKCFVNDTLMTDVTGCDSVVVALNSGIKTFYSDTTIIDTIPQQFNCDLIKTYLVRVREGTDVPSVTGDVNITDTSMIYTYEALTKNDVVEYEWHTSPTGVIVGGDASSMIHIKWNSIGQENLKLIVYNRDRCSDSTNVLVNVTHVVGINQSRNNSFEVYPNPTTKEITIDNFNNNEELGLTVFDVHGKKILQQKIQNQLKIDLHEFQSGVYFIRIGNTVKRFVKL